MDTTHEAHWIQTCVCSSATPLVSLYPVYLISTQAGANLSGVYSSFKHVSYTCIVLARICACVHWALYIRVQRANWSVLCMLYWATTTQTWSIRFHAGCVYSSSVRAQCRLAISYPTSGTYVMVLPLLHDHFHMNMFVVLWHAMNILWFCF